MTSHTCQQSPGDCRAVPTAAPANHTGAPRPRAHVAVGSSSSSQTPEQTPWHRTRGHTGKGQSHRPSKDPSPRTAWPQRPGLQNVGTTEAKDQIVLHIYLKLPRSAF